MTASRVRIAVIGLGRMGLSHLSILRPHPNVEIVGVCDDSRYVLDVVQRYTGLEGNRDYRALIDATGPDAVVVATPSGSHAEICEHVIGRGLSVFLEKPLALNLASGKELVELAEHAGVTAQVGYHFRFVPSFEQAKRWFDRRLIGDAHYFRVGAFGPTVLRARGTTWRTRRSEGGGCLYDYASHVANLSNFVFGTPNGVGGAVLRSIFSSGVDDEVHATLYHENAVAGQLSANWSDATQRKMSMRLEIWGSNGKIVADRQECHLFLRDEVPDDPQLRAGWNVRRVTDLIPPVRYYVRGEEYTRQLDHFVASVESRRTPETNSFASAYETDVVLELIREDWERREGTRVSPVSAMKPEAEAPK